jgi:hypothetical protein
MATDPNNCLICDWPASRVKITMSRDNLAQVFECPRCGTYEALNELVAISHRWPSEIAQPLSCAARQASEEQRPARITGSNAVDLARPHMNSRVVDNQERLLREIAKRAFGRPQRAAPFAPANDFALIDCYNNDEFNWYVESLTKQGLVTRTGGSSSTLYLTLTDEGWKRIQPAPHPGGIPGQCFVAMWLSDETRAAYADGIKPAIVQAGCTAIRIDQKEHNNEIPDEIIAEIRNSQFMVADFTGQRLGVYYEAGFAMGLGRKVIWCCRKDQIDKLHFDTNHKNHIDWETPQELGRRLYTRIRATILDVK